MYTSLLVAVVVVLLASSLLSLHTTARLSESVAAVSHTQRLQERINRLWGLLGDRDTHILRYLLLGRELHVEEFHNILRQMEKAQAQLQQEVGDDPVQRAALAEIDRLHQERIERAEYLIALKRRAMAGEPGAQAQLDEEFEAIPSNGNAEAMRALLEAMSEHEVAELERQQHQREQSIRQNRIIVLGANFLAVIAGVATLLAFRRLRRREDEALRASIEAQQAHRIASERQASLEVVAHDLRGHFGNLMLAAELLPTAHSDDARSRLAESVRGSATSGLLFLRAVLEQAAGEARGDTTTRLELEEALQAVCAEFADAAAAKGMRIEMQPGPAVALRGQSAALMHVLRNLVSNAVKYAPVGSSVEIVAEDLGDRGRVRVLDRGPGVPAHERARLFQRYLPLSTQPTGGEPATGLGLALARQHARAQGGDLRYEDRPGGGACFILDWPLA